MYHPPSFMTVEVLAEVLAEFTWPSPYTLDSDLPDGIGVVFARCSLYFTEGFESAMDVSFLPNGRGLLRAAPIAEAIELLRKDSNRTLPDPPRLINFFCPHAALEKVRNELRDLCTLLLTYHGPTLDGDFDWAAGSPFATPYPW
jgi:hypothetical protein